MPLRPPPPERLPDRLRRWVQAWGAYTGLTRWLLVRGSILFLAFAALYVVNGTIIGWKTAYDVTIGITSPGDAEVSTPVLAWFLSIAGWLAAPAVCGGVAGVVITVAVTDRRKRNIAEVLTRTRAPYE